mmetsp:Transcript_31534/g.70864  ORF Transcript_31534/g.70864 Transcript_31534/m.70864 type:complete len:209 (-) Transcript_31534:1273-1899(-)
MAVQVLSMDPICRLRSRSFSLSCRSACRFHISKGVKPLRSVASWSAPKASSNRTASGTIRRVASCKIPRPSRVRKPMSAPAWARSSRAVQVASVCAARIEGARWRTDGRGRGRPSESKVSRVTPLVPCRGVDGLGAPPRSTPAVPSPLIASPHASSVTSSLRQKSKARWTGALPRWSTTSRPSRFTAIFFFCSADAPCMFGTGAPVHR